MEEAINYLESIFFQLLFNSQEFLQNNSPFIFAARQVLEGGGEIAGSHFVALYSFAVSDQREARQVPTKLWCFYPILFLFSISNASPATMVEAPKLTCTRLFTKQTNSVSWFMTRTRIFFYQFCVS